MSYEIFAKYYDAALGDRQATIELLLDKKDEHAPHAKNLLDIGCGTGKLTKLICASAETFGIDVYEPMIALAKQQFPEADFRVCDVLQFSMQRKFELITAIGDPFNHLPELSDWELAFSIVHRHLADGGVFIFDFLTPAFLDYPFARATVFRQFEDDFFLMNFSQGRENFAEWVIREFQHLEGNNYKTKENRIIEYVYPVDQVFSALHKVGFNTLEVSGKNRCVSYATDRRLMLVCKKWGAA